MAHTRTRNGSRAGLAAFMALFAFACAVPEENQAPVEDADLADPGAASPLDSGTTYPVPSNLPDPPLSCEPAACEGATDDAPAWGCPSACEPSCLGDTVCCDDATCLSRDFDECAEGCAVEPTIALHRVGEFGNWVKVCNRGVEAAEAQDWRILLTVEGEVLLDRKVGRPLSSCECAWFSFEIPFEVYTSNDSLVWSAEVDATLIAMEEDCGSPKGRVDFAHYGFLLGAE